MSEYKKVCYVNVPVNELGVTEHESWDMEWEHVVTFELSRAEFDLLYRIFADWDKMFHILIGIYEEEILEARHVGEALEILRKHNACHLKETDKEYFAASAKLEEALELAERSSTCVFLDF